MLTLVWPFCIAHRVVQLNCYKCLTSTPALQDANFARTAGVIWVFVDFAAATNAECGTWYFNHVGTVV